MAVQVRVITLFSGTGPGVITSPKTMIGSASQLSVVVATPVEFRNSDAILHNVHTNSKKNEPFSRLQAPAAAKIVHVFESPEVIHIGCDIHSQMSAYIVVVPNRFFTKASKNGAFTLKGVPPGTYKLVAWCEKYRTVSKTVEVKAGVTTQTDMDFQKKI